MRTGTAATSALFLSLAASGLCCLVGCSHHESGPAGPSVVEGGISSHTAASSPATPQTPTPVAPVATNASDTGNISGTAFAAAFSAVDAAVKPYTVSPTLAEVSNYEIFNEALPISDGQKKMLAHNLFACTPTDAPQLFHIYEQNDYLNVPSFVSSDLVLQMYHIFYDFTLRKVEAGELAPALQQLTLKMLTASTRTWNAASDPAIKTAALKNVAFFGVAAKSLGLEVTLPAAAQMMVQQEMDLIDAHAGFALGAIFPYKLDYSQFVPRGHYTRSEALKRYFRAMMWYGLAPFSLKYATASGEVRADEQIRQGLLWVHDLYNSKLDGEWDRIYEPTAFYVGMSDDLTPEEWKSASDSVYGANPAPAIFASGPKLDAFYTAAQKLRNARIQPRFGRLAGTPAGTPNMIEPPLPEDRQLRFMGQRYIPDSEILQKLSVPIKRPFPSGLDVMAVLGSPRAASILDASPEIYNADDWTAYRVERSDLVKEFAATDPRIWSSNLYWSWLDVLRTLLQPVPAGYPSFMQSAAWQDKSIHTALASWAELRHDTVLYGKQSTAECGGGEDTRPYVRGYVEPNEVLYDRLLKLNHQSREGLEKRKLLLPNLKDRFEQFDDLLTLLKEISTRELHNQKLTSDEYDEIRFIGGKFEHLTLSVMDGKASEWDLVSESDRDMAVIADVHSGANQVLEEGVGHPEEILVIVPVEGKLELARGAIFSYYEFKHDASDRLTDEAWQKILKEQKAPLSPEWTKSFLLPSGRHSHFTPDQLESFSSGC